MKNFTILSILILLILTSCGTSNKVVKDTDALKATWVLQNENQPELGLSDEPISIQFDAEGENKISGFAGCNYYGGTYVSDQGQVMISDIFSTKRACPSLEVEQEYLNLLDQVDRFAVNGNNLYLYKGKLLLLHFKKEFSFNTIYNRYRIITVAILLFIFLRSLRQIK